MPLWSRKKPEEAPPAPPPLPEIEQLAELIPERNQQEEFLWQDYVERIVERFDGLPAPDGGESLVRACLAAGCKAVPVIRLSPLWEKGLSEREWHRRESSDLAARVRLGLFFAASLRYLVHALCRLRIKTGKVQWHPLMDLLRAGEVYWRPLLGGGVSFRDLQAASDDTMEITWLDVVPTHAQVCTLTPRFLQAYEVSLLTLELAVDVLACAQPGSPGGLFGRMLFNEGQIKAKRVDVAGLCLEALRQLAWSRRLRLNSNPGDLFVTPELSFLVAPAAVDVLIKVLRRRGHSFTRQDIYRALGDAGCLAGIAPGAKRHTRLAKLKSPAWRGPFDVRGLAIVHTALWDVQMPPGYLDGTIKVEG